MTSAANPLYTQPMQSAEIELKFPVSDPAALQSRLAPLGLILQTPRTFERNTLYDTPARTLRDARQILRIRQYGDSWVLTHKRQPEDDPRDGTRYKVRIETETTVADGHALAEIVHQLGYEPVFHYEKYRTEWACPTPAGSPGHLVLDETPIGTWAELEGQPEWIDATLARLGIDQSTCSTDSYGKLFLTWKQRTRSPANHLTFDEIPPGARWDPA